MTGCTRFAPSTTGPAHPGTLLSALLVWLEARSQHRRLVLRLENLDPERCKPHFATAMAADLAWFGLDWDLVQYQDRLRAQHEAALDRLAVGGHLYPCRCSRAELRAAARPAADGGWAYDNRCRGRALPVGGWRACAEAIRVMLPLQRVELIDDGGSDLSQTPALDMGDPVVVRRDGAFAYHLVVVVDDAAAGVTHVVRGRDLAASTATQILLQRLLELPTPRYRHHLLLLEPRGPKLAKLHGAVGAAVLREHYTPAGLCGFLAHAAGLRSAFAPCVPAELLNFAWADVACRDRVVRWTGAALELGVEA